MTVHADAAAGLCNRFVHCIVNIAFGTRYHVVDRNRMASKAQSIAQALAEAYVQDQVAVRQNANQGTSELVGPAAPMNWRGS